MKEEKEEKDALLKLYNALTGEDSQLSKETLNDFYEIMCQFDDDEPIFLAKNIPLNNDFKMVFKAPLTKDHNLNNNFIEFIDQTTGKKIKIFSRFQK